jgi:hypothetical protein
MSYHTSGIDQGYRMLRRRNEDLEKELERKTNWLTAMRAELVAADAKLKEARALAKWAEAIVCNGRPMKHCSQEEWDSIVKNWRDRRHEIFPDGAPHNPNVGTDLCPCPECRQWRRENLTPVHPGCIPPGTVCEIVGHMDEHKPDCGCSNCQEMPAEPRETIPGPCSNCGAPDHWRPDCPEIAEFVRWQRQRQRAKDEGKGGFGV